MFVFPDTGQHVRTITLDAEPWFVATDVCAILKHTNTTVALGSLDDDEKRTIRRSEALNFPYPIDDLRVQSAAFVNEPGLYSLILRSNLPAARAFKRWITHDVIPAIRKTGTYAMPLGDPLDEIEAATARTAHAVAIARAERDRADAAEARAAELQPSADAWDTLASTGADYSAREAAYILRRAGHDTGQFKLLGKIREYGMVDPFDRPYYAHRDHIVLRPRSYTDAEGVEQEAKPQIRITYAGLRYLHKRLGGTGQLPDAAVAAKQLPAGTP